MIDNIACSTKDSVSDVNEISKLVFTKSKVGATSDRKLTSTQIKSSTNMLFNALQARNCRLVHILCMYQCVLCS